MSKQKLPSMEKDFAKWYQEVIFQAKLVDQSPVRGCFVIRPYGTSIWENIKDILDKKIKKTGHKNAIFPLLIPKSFITKEAEHVKGFSPELAVVTHAGGKELEEPLVVRPTSETMVHYMFAKWIKSWRDLPLKINQWANVVRWEMRPRAFLRTTEFFWQEGHTAHGTAQEAEQEAKMMLQEYVDLAQNYLAVPVVAGLKSESEKFPGADKTFTFEALMPDGKAVQMGTSHIISRNFAKAFGMSYQNREGELDYPFLTSWGATSRLIGAAVMVHGDQKGLILPPKIAPIQVVIVPILKKDTDNQAVVDFADQVKKDLAEECSVFVDYDETKTPGAKFYKWELKGVPIRIEIGPRDVQKNKVVVVDRLGESKQEVLAEDIKKYVVQLLVDMQEKLFERAKQKLQQNWHSAEKLSQFGKDLADMGGFYQTGWCRNPECEKELKQYQATIRCLLDEKEAARCFHCEKDSVSDVLVAKPY